jgi:hypothetical protein
MGGIQGIRNLDAQIERRFDLQRLACNPMLQRHAFQILHGDEGLVTVSADLIDRADIRVVQSGSGTGFATEPFQCLWVLRDIFGKELQCGKATEGGVLSLIDDAHPAAAELLDNAVVGNGLAHELGRSSHWLGMLSGHKGQGQRRT